MASGESFCLMRQSPPALPWLAQAHAPPKHSFGVRPWVVGWGVGLGKRAPGGCRGRTRLRLSSPGAIRCHAGYLLLVAPTPAGQSARADCAGHPAYPILARIFEEKAPS